MKKILWDIDNLPICDLQEVASLPCGPAIYDAPTVAGPWANLCEVHMRNYGIPGPAFQRVSEEKLLMDATKEEGHLWDD